MSENTMDPETRISESFREPQFVKLMNKRKTYISDLIIRPINIT
jgi:hypothetical protein